MKKLLSLVTALCIIGAAAPGTGFFKSSDSFEAVAADPVEGEDVLIAVVNAGTMDYIPGVTVDIELDNGKYATIVTEEEPVIFHHGGHSGIISIAAMPAGYTYAEGFTRTRAFMEDSEGAMLWLEADESYVPETTAAETTTTAAETTTTAAETTTTSAESTTTAAETTTSAPESTTYTDPVRPILFEEIADGSLTIGVCDYYAVVAKYNSDKAENVVIPRNIMERSVQYIGPGAFKDSAVSSINIPDTIGYIETSAFERCTGLEKVILPKSVRNISKDAFKDCADLRSIVILNPDCKIDDSPYTINNERLDGTGSKPDAHFSGIIYGYKNSTAQEYAEKYGYKFVTIDGESHNTADVYVTIADDKHVLQTACEPVTVFDFNSDGRITVDEALYAAHDKFYEGGAAAGYSSEMGTYGLMLTRLWGIENGAAFGYVVNDKFAVSLEDDVKSGDVVYAFAYSDLKSYTDAYAKFDSPAVEGNAGEPIALKLSRSYFDESYKQTFAPLSGAVITVDGTPTDYVTDENGEVSIIINEAGRHVISAASEDYNIVPPVCIADVKGSTTERPEPTVKGDANLDNNVNIADAVLVMQVATNPDKYAVGRSEVSIKLQGEVNADVDGSAGLTNRDALLIQKFKLGLVSTL